MDEKFLRLELDSPLRRSLRILRAVSSEQRLRMLEFVGNGQHTVTQIARALNLPLSTTAVHVKILEDAGLLSSRFEPSSHGLSKICNRTYDKLLLDMTPRPRPADKVLAVSMPIGNYSSCNVEPYCGLASTANLIGALDDPMAFYEPLRLEAQLLWFHSGYVEYLFPNRMDPNSRLVRLQMTVELAGAATPPYINMPAEITLWINDVEVGTWILPGISTGQPNQLNTVAWENGTGFHGSLICWQVDNRGSYIDETPLSSITLESLNIHPNRPIKLCLGCKADAQHRGGLQLFGAKLGRYSQDLLLLLEQENLNTLP